jgi:hypothetical protein
MAKTAKTELALEEGMPASRALRRRARTYIGEALELMNGKSGLTKAEQIKLITKANKRLAKASADLVAAAEARETE